jgi:hypothetical protein
MTYSPWLGPWEATVIEGDNITPSLLVWRRYKRPAAGVLENLLDMNPDLVEGLSQSPYLPVGAIVRVPIDQAAISGAPQSIKQATLWGANPPP